MRRLLPFIAIAALILVAGCPTLDHRIKLTRQTDTGILAGEQIVVLLLRYRLEGNLVKDLGSTEGRFEWCIRTAMQEVKDDLTFLPPAALRKLVSADTTAALTAYAVDEGTQSPDSLLGLLAEPVTAARLAEAQVRYVVQLEASYSTSKSTWEFAGSGGGCAWKGVETILVSSGDHP